MVIRLAGDSGDGIQLTGTEFTRAVALGGSDIATFPDIPAEIRAPAGSLAGVSGFQLQFSSQEIFTAGDAPDALVAMNPAALRTNLPDLPKGGLLIVDSGTFRKKSLAMAGYEVSPLEDGSLEDYRLVDIDISKNVQATQKGSGLSTKEIQRTRNFYALGVPFWLYGRPPETEVESIERKFGKRPAIAEGNVRSFRAGYHFGETCELFDASYRVPSAQLAPGTYRNITGNEATALGLVVASQLADQHLFYASYPITPASDVLHSLSNHRRYGLTTFQAEDEIAAVTSAIGASFGGSIGVTGTSGPGFALKQEGIGLAVMAELPLVVLNVQRAGPSTGLPTKAEQADLNQALSGRNSESPVVVLAPRTPADCFDMAIEAVRISVRHMCPVVFLSDGSLASGSEAWKLPDPETFEPIEVRYRSDPEGFMPYLRDEETLARPWAIPGTPGLEHRIGGLEKEDRTGNVSYDPLNHEHMVRMRQAKVDRVADYVPAAEVEGDDAGQLLFVGWGGTYGAIHQAVRVLRNQGHRVGHLHLRFLNPFPHGIAEILSRFERVLVPELNRGQLRDLLRARFLVDAHGLNKIQGRPFKVCEVVEAGQAQLSGPSAREVSL